MWSVGRHYPQEGGRFPATWEMLWVAGWAPHPSQPKPLKPGSATHSLAEALRPQPSPGTDSTG